MPSKGQVGDLHRPGDTGRGFSGVTESDKNKAGGKLPGGSSVSDRVKNGAKVAADAAKNAKKDPKKK